MKKLSVVFVFLILQSIAAYRLETSREMPNPLSKINILQTQIDLRAKIQLNELRFGKNGRTSDNVEVTYFNQKPTQNDWIGVFSPANFRMDSCPELNPGGNPPKVCRAPIKFQYASFKNPGYLKTGSGKLQLTLINQRQDFQMGLFTGSFENPILIAESEIASWEQPKAPTFPRLAQGKQWDEMTVTWTSGYGIEDAEPFAEYGPDGGSTTTVFAGTLTFDRDSMCDNPARSVGWRDPGYIHTAILKNLRPNIEYVYKVGHNVKDGSPALSQEFRFRASPFPGQKSVQRVAILSNMGKADEDGSTEADQFQPGSRKTTDQLVQEVNQKTIDMVFHLGDLACAQGYLSQWDQFTHQIEPISSQVPYMIASGNQERNCPNCRSFYTNNDSGGECGVVAETMFYTPSENRAKLWYSTDFGMFRFCVVNSELDWRKGTEQNDFIDQCLSTVDRKNQPWLVLVAHRVLGYSSSQEHALQGSFGEPMGRVHIQKLLQKHKVDLAIFGHVQGYERSFPVYQDTVTDEETTNYKGMLNGTIYLVAGGGGAAPQVQYTEPQPSFSLKRNSDFGFVKLTAFNHSSLLCEYKQSNDGKVVDSFTITKEYRDILACGPDSCGRTTLAA